MPNLAHTILYYRLLALLATCFIICRYNVLYSTKSLVIVIGKQASQKKIEPEPFHVNYP